jgi:cell division ATPase FtsA
VRRFTGLTLEPLASSDAVLSQKERKKEAGVAL